MKLWLARCLQVFGIAFAVVMAPTPAAETAGTRALGGHTVSLASAHGASAAAPDRLALTFTLRRSDEAGFRQFLRDVYDPASPQFRRFLTQREIADRFGPAQGDVDGLAAWLGTQGFSVRADAVNRLTLEAVGTRDAAERAFGVHIGSYASGARTFYANDRDPALPAALADRVLAISGLSDLAQPHALINDSPPPYYQCPNGVDPAYCDLYGPLCAVYAGARGTGEFLQEIGNSVNGMGVRDYVKSYNTYNQNVQKYYENCLNNTFTDRPPARPDGTSTAWKNIDGSGQTIGLVEFDQYNPNDVIGFLALTSAPAATITHLSDVTVGGGASFGAGESEVLLDIDTVLSLAPNANVIVYNAAPNGGGGSFQPVLQRMLNDGLVSVISNSWAYCEDQTTLADVQSLDSILQSAAAGGISVFSGSGDSGSTCLDGAANTVAVPADSPNLTAVGGTSLVSGAGGVYKGETWWNGSAHTPPSGQGGFGVSRFFSRPSYQDPFTAANGRSVPDVAAEADPAAGIALCQADAGGCPTGSLYGGTSMATPIWAAFAALLNQSHGARLGLINAAAYAHANGGGFHTAAALNSDFAHVGLGSPNLNLLALQLNGQSAGAVDATESGVLPLAPPIAPGTDPSGIAADGATTAIVLVTLRDANGNSVGGQSVSLTAAGSHAVISPASGTTSANDGSIQFKVTDTFVENATFSAHAGGFALTQTPTLAFVAPPPHSVLINASPNAQVADGRSTSTVTVTLTDALSRPIAGKHIVLAQSGNSILNPVNGGVTDASGAAQFLVTDQLSESVTYSATDVSDGELALPGTASVAFSGGSGCGVGAAPVAGPGYALSVYASGIPAQSNVTLGGVTLSFCAGVGGIAFDPAGNLYASALLNGDVYKFPPGGGIAGSANRLTNVPLGSGLGALVYSGGSLYAERIATGATINTGAMLKIDPTTGSPATVASGLNCPFSLAADPLSGDLFYADGCFNTGMDDAVVHRIANPGGASPLLSDYATTYGAPNGGLSFAPDGTLYVCADYTNPGVAGTMQSIAGTNQPQPASVSPLGIACNFSAAAVGTNPSGGAQSLLVGSFHTAGLAYSVAAFDLTVTPPVFGGSTLVETDIGGQKILGPDNCVYLNSAGAVYKLTNADGSCGLAGLASNPSIVLTPQDTPATAAQGTSQLFDVHFPHNSVPLGTPIAYAVQGANQLQRVGSVGFGNSAIIGYTGVDAGVDTIVAYATIGGNIVQSNPVEVTWTAGKHTTLVTANAAASAANRGSSAPVSATLLDVSLQPPAPLVGATLTFTLAGQQCSGTTDANGTASCRIVAAAAGRCTLGVAYAGDATHLGASQSVDFLVSAYDLVFANGFETPGGNCIL